MRNLETMLLQRTVEMNLAEEVLVKFTLAQICGGGGEFNPSQMRYYSMSFVIVYAK